MKICKNLLLTMGGIIVAFLLLEGGLRLIGIYNPNFWTMDEYRGYALKPDLEGWCSKEGKVYIHISSDGLRDKEHSKVKPANTVRIAILGASYAEALQVPLENTFWSVLEQELSKCNSLRGKKIECINFGVSGYGTAQDLITLQKKVWDYSPDIVLLLFTGNDISVNSRALKKVDYVPYYVYKGNSLTLDNSFRESTGYKLRTRYPGKLLYDLINYSRTLQALYEAKEIIMSLMTRYHAPGNNHIDIDIDEMLYSGPVTPEWKEAWRVTEGLLLMMRDEVKKKGAEFVVVPVSSGIQVDPDPMVRRKFMDRLGITDLFYTNSRIKALGEKYGFRVIDIVEALQGYAEKNGTYLHGSKGEGHWNKQGHYMYGNMLAGEMCRDIWNKSGPGREQASDNTKQ